MNPCSRGIVWLSMLCLCYPCSLLDTQEGTQRNGPWIFGEHWYRTLTVKKTFESGEY